jgi:hypothetical protein
VKILEIRKRTDGKQLNTNSQVASQGPQLPDGVPAMLFPLSRCGEWDLALPLELALVWRCWVF